MRSKFPGLALAAGLVCSALIILAPGTAGGNEGATEEPVKIRPVIDPDTRICKRYKPTGSHVSQRICLRQKEWQSMEAAARRELRNVPDAYQGNPETRPGSR